MLAWVDLETTGLDPQNDVILEIGVQLTLDDLTFVNSDSAVIQHFGTLALPDLVQKMHTKNGLLAELRYGEPLAEAELRMIALLQALPEPSPMCGSSVHFDRGFLKKHMPRLEAMFHYRNIDISTVKELAARWLPMNPTLASIPVPVPQKLHRVDPDLEDTIAEASFYRDVIFTPMLTVSV